MESKSVLNKTIATSDMITVAPSVALGKKKLIT